MNGPAGDGFLIFLGILVLATVTIKLWYPLVVRAVGKIRSDLDKAKQDEVDFTHAQDLAHHPKDTRPIERRTTSSSEELRRLSNMTPLERSQYYKERIERRGRAHD